MRFNALEIFRRGHDDLGDHYLDCGDLSNALKCYSRARDYCTSAKHVVTMCLNVIKVSVYLQNWSHVSSYVSKAESTPSHAPEVSVLLPSFRMQEYRILLANAIDRGISCCRVRLATIKPF